MPLEVPREFQRSLLKPPKRSTLPEAVAALEAFANAMQSELGDIPQLYQLNRARLALADRHELLRRGTPARDRGKLDEVFNRSYSALFDQFLARQSPELSPPAPPIVQPPPEPPRPRSVAEAMEAALKQVIE